MLELALAAVAAVTPFLVKGAETLVGEAAKEGWKERGTIWEKVKGLFSSDDEMLHIYEKYPKSEDIQKDFAVKLQEKLEAAPDTAKELQELLEKLPGGSKVNTINQTGDNNQAFQDISGSTINFNK